MMPYEPPLRQLNYDVRGENETSVGHSFPFFAPIGDKSACTLPLCAACLRHSLCVPSSPFLSFGFKVVREFNLRARGFGAIPCAVTATLEVFSEFMGDHSSTEIIERVDTPSQSCYRLTSVWHRRTDMGWPSERLL